MSIDLFRRDDFREIVEATARQKGIANPAIVEKDYFVTEALRIISQKHGHHTIFKGGTSLSKGWSLIERFSEDIDLYVKPADTSNATGRLLKQIANDVSSYGGFEEPERIASIDNIARSTRHRYDSAFEKGGAIQSSVLLEIGIQSGTYPTEERQIRSLLAEVLIEAGVKDLGEDGQAFPMQLLHYKRTVIEKMFALHDKVERGVIDENKPIGTYARHYYDTYQLLQQQDVQEMFEQHDHIEICKSYRELTQRYFPAQRLPAHMNLNDSRALFPNQNLARQFSAEYKAQCSALCFGQFPEFEDVLAEYEKIRRYFVDVTD